MGSGAAAVAMVAALLLSGCSAVERISDAVEGQPADVDLLAAVSLTESDAAQDAVLQPYEGGNEVIGRTSLDLCDGDFPSEDLRSGRNQVWIGDVDGGAWVSSEAVLYPTPADAEQAMDELQRAHDQCPDEPVQPEQQDRDPRVWSFSEAPDADWPQEPGIARQAYAFQVTDPLEESFTSTATYLQRGRMLLALYATPPDSPTDTLVNAPAPARFVEVMSKRLAGLPETALESGPALPKRGGVSA